MARIAAYSIIGNCRSAALVSNKGSIDWCCLPEFHSPALFAALLDEAKGGHFSINPAGEFQSVQRYVDDTNVLETIFTCEQGEAKLTDTFVAMSEQQKAYSLFPDHEILRVVQGIAGTVRFKLHYEPGIFYGKNSTNLENRKKLGIKYSWKDNSYVLQSTIPYTQFQIRKGVASVEFVVRPGQTEVLSLACSSGAPAILPELKETAIDRLNKTISYWNGWIKQCNYNGIYKEEVKRSALVLKLLAHAPSGAIIAAPSTSLPEEIGGVRNWDYRYCWLRDASFTVRALLKLGFDQEAHAYMGWILHATRLTQPKLQVVYSVYGHFRLEERQLYWLQGFENSRPVRVGNGAHNQFQLDVYGEVLDAFFSYASIVDNVDRSTKRFILGLGDIICKEWNKPDNGIWEKRSQAKHHTHSKVMAWVGLDRIIKLCEKYKWDNARTRKYERTKTEIEQTVQRLGFNKKLHCYTDTFEGESLDASSLVFPLVGYRAASSSEMISTVQQIYSQLSKNNLIYRYNVADDGLAGSEGCFGICSFWMAEMLAKMGHVTKAIEIFNTILAHAGQTGLLAEEIDPVTHELLGNYPQGFTHIGLINAAFSINKALENGGRTNEHH